MKYRIKPLVWSAAPFGIEEINANTLLGVFVVRPEGAYLRGFDSSLKKIASGWAEAYLKRMCEDYHRKALERYLEPVK